ncbi:MAG: aminodeoxychorismate synthase component I [Bacteroidales bacterium]|nr:aminodeoxychorismate synthase component I [Bacteroidales bacterium]MDD4058887.1 aminodeoxychorismate synthase component I [Bacteroidales bacterium]
MNNIFYNIAEVSEMMDRDASSGMPFLFALDYEMKEGLFISEPHTQEHVLYKFENGSNCVREMILSHSADFMSLISSDNIEKYQKKFEVLIKGLKRGDSYLANLTCKSEVETQVDARTIFLSTHSPFALYVPDRFLSFTPERFVRIEDGIISSCPMKGTIDASIPNAKERILSDYKESCEHATITDLIRNDLGIVSDEVWVDSYRFIDKISTDRGEILQVSSDIRGRLKSEYKNSLGRLMLSLLPAGSISGAPKLSTINLIAQAEEIPRGFYTGVAGLYDGKVLDSCVLIRFLEFASDGKVYYRSGGGITINSKVEEEYEEMLKKIYLPLNK